MPQQRFDLMGYESQTRVFEKLAFVQFPPSVGYSVPEVDDRLVRAAAIGNICGQLADFFALLRPVYCPQQSA